MRIVNTMKIGNKSRGGLTCTFHGTIFVILLCKVTGTGDFEKHKFSLINGKKLPKLNPTDTFFKLIHETMNLNKLFVELIKVMLPQAHPLVTPKSSAPVGLIPPSHCESHHPKVTETGGLDITLTATQSHRRVGNHPHIPSLPKVTSAGIPLLAGFTNLVVRTQ